MQEALKALTTGLKFQSKDGKKRSAPELSPEKGLNKVQRIDTATKDVQEAANLVRKRNRIRASGVAVPPPLQSFEELGQKLDADGHLFSNLSAANFTSPTPVQSQVLPLLFGSRDVIAMSPTGSGKTLAFALPILADACKAHKAAQMKGVSAVILVPSRELAEQIGRELVRLAAHTRLRIVLIRKATAAGEDFSKVDVIVGTPVRLQRTVRLRQLDLSHTKYLVLDEADKLLEQSEDKGSFIQEIDQLVATCQNPELTISMFSATIPEKVEQLARTILKDAVRVTVGSRNSAAWSVKQDLHFVGSEEGKILLLQDMVQSGLQAPALVFVASSEKAAILQKRLVAENISVDCIFSKQDFASRQNAMSSFRAGKTWLLITTDLLARGIDFVGVKTVINYDCPASTQDYVHRIGRTGRGSQQGRAVTFFTEKDKSLVRPLANLIAETGQEVPKWMLLKTTRSRSGKQQHGELQRKKQRSVQHV